MRLWGLRCPDYAGSSVYTARPSLNREGHSGRVESVGINIDERSRDDHRALGRTRVEALFAHKARGDREVQRHRLAFAHREGATRWHLRV
jgi:hypothetical protein